MAGREHNPKCFDPRCQRRRLQPKQFRGTPRSRYFTLRSLQCCKEVVGLDLTNLGIRANLGSRTTGGYFDDSCRCREFDIEPTAGRSYHGTLDGVLEFPQHPLSESYCWSRSDNPRGLALASAGRLLRAAACKKWLARQRDVFDAQAERPHFHGEDAQPVGPVLAGRPAAASARRSRLPRRHHPDVNFAGDAPRQPVRVRPPEAPATTWPKVPAGFPRPHRGTASRPRPVQTARPYPRHGFREGPLGVAEELALVQFARNRGPPDVDERPAPSAPAGDLHNEFLAGTAPAEDQDRRIGRGQPGRSVTRPLGVRPRALADQFAECPRPGDLLAQVLVLQFQPFSQGLDLGERPQR